jgi:hypothetical protein
MHHDLARLLPSLHVLSQQDIVKAFERQFMALMVGFNNDPGRVIKVAQNSASLASEAANMKTNASYAKKLHAHSGDVPSVVLGRGGSEEVVRRRHVCDPSFICCDVSGTVGALHFFRML